MFQSEYHVYIACGEERNFTDVNDMAITSSHERLTMINVVHMHWKILTTVRECTE